MKKLGTIVLTLILIITIFGINPVVNANEGSAWKQILQFKINHSAISVGFINETCGITVGVRGQCYYTTDGGKTWPQAQNESQCRFGMDYINEKTVWNCGNFSQVRRSDDGGQTWKKVSDCIVGNFISFINDQTGWIANDMKLVATNNGGESWIELKSPTFTISAISLLSEKEGYILDTNNTLYFTKDAGNKWNSQKINTNETLLLPVIRFFDTNRAILIGYSSEQKKELALITTDGGKTWRSEVVDDKLGRAGRPYLSRDGKILTLFCFDNTVTVLQYE